VEQKVVTVVGASGRLGTAIVQALLVQGAHVRALVRATSDRRRLESLGVRDFAVADLMDAASLQRALAAEPKATAVVASAAGFSAHSARTKGDNSRADTEGYRHLVDATLAAGVPRFVLISILECDKAPKIPHFSPKLATERYLAEQHQPYLALRAGAFLDRAKDVVAQQVKKGFFPDIVPGVAMDMIYSPDLARYAAQAALELPLSAFNQSVDIGCAQAATGPMVAAAFSQVLGHRVVAKPLIPQVLIPLLPLARPFVSSYLRDQLAVFDWIRKGGYVSQNRDKQHELFGELPTIRDAVSRYCRDKELIP